MHYDTDVQAIEGLIRTDTLPGNVQVYHDETIEDRMSQTFFPSVYLTEDLEPHHKIYFELENTLVFSRFVKQMKLKESSKGVFRLQRKVHTSKRHYLLYEDLMVLENLFGDIDSIHVLHSKKSSDNPYIIVTLLFKNRTMAHVECHVSNKEELHLEWNGIHNLVVFNSKEMNSVSVETVNTSIPLNLQLCYKLLSKNAYEKSSDLVATYQKWMNFVKEAE